MSRSSFDVADLGLEVGHVGRALAAAPTVAASAQKLGSGRDTGAYLTLLRGLGEVDLVSARVLEPHLDACAIADQAGFDLAGHHRPEATWGVYASASPGLRASKDDTGWRLEGEKRWCSLADRLDAALVTAQAEDGPRLFAVDLQRSDVEVLPTPWEARGLREITSPAVRFHGASVEPVGDPGFYLGRDGFAWGGIGVAAVWIGGVDGLVTRMRRSVAERPPDDMALFHLGQLEIMTGWADALLDDAARRIDAGRAGGLDGELLCGRLRAFAAEHVERAIRHVGHALGPAPMTGEADMAARLADLEVYVRQHHAERDVIAYGRTIAGSR